MKLEFNSLDELKDFVDWALSPAFPEEEEATYTKTCTACGAEFETAHQKARKCDACKGLKA